MKIQRVEDERVTALRRKISSDGYNILMGLLLCSLIIQQLIFKAPFKQYAAEFICFFGMSFYTIIRSAASGINLFEREKRAKKILIINGAVTVTTLTVLTGIMYYNENKQLYAQEGIGKFIAVLVIFFVVISILVTAALYLFYYINKKKQLKIQQELDDKEQD